MKLILLLLSFFWLSILYAQNDSMRYFQSQLKRQGLSDSAKTHYNLKIGNHLVESDPIQAIIHFTRAYSSANKTSINQLLCASSTGLATVYYDKGNFDSSLFYAKISHSVAQRDINIPLLYTSLKLLGNIYMEKLELPEAKLYYDDALKISVDNASIPHRSQIYMNLGNYYFKSFNFQEALKMLKTGEIVAEKSKEQDDRMQIFTSLGLTYAYTGKADSVQYYLFEALNYFHQNRTLKYEALANQKLGIAYGLFNNTAKMEQYLDMAYKQLLIVGNTKGAINTRMLKANNYFKSYQFDKCLQVINATEPVALKYKEKPGLALCYMYKAGIFSISGDSTNARMYQSVAERLNKEINNPIFEQMNMFIKAVVMSTRLKMNLGDSVTREVMKSVKKMIPMTLLKSTLENISFDQSTIDSNRTDYRNVYTTVLSKNRLSYSYPYESLVGLHMDSTISIVFNKHILEMETQYKTKEKDNRIILLDKEKEIKEVKLNQQSRNILLIASLAVLFLLTTVAILLMYQRKKALYNLGIQKMEIKFLRSQLNPHFVSNALTAIRKYIRKHPDVAEEYFDKYSNLMREVLINSEEETIYLQEEFSMLKKYMDLESIRLPNRFDYDIIIDPSVDIDVVKVPPLIFQPIVENAIWHGIAGRSERGKISIYVFLVKDILKCEIENHCQGIRTHTIVSEKNRKSFGIKISSERLKLLSKEKGTNWYLETTPLTDGMKVKIGIPV